MRNDSESYYLGYSGFVGDAKNLLGAKSDYRLWNGTALTHHADPRDRNTPSVAFGKRCKEAGVRPSMGSVGDAYDNAMCESFFATLECELLDRRRFASQAEARIACFSFIEGWYNPVRLHSALNYRSPIRYEHDMQTELLPTKS